MYYKENKKGRAIGEVIRGIKQQWNGEECTMEENRIVGRMMKIGKNKIKIWTVYNRDDMKKMKEKIDGIIKAKGEEMMILGGDFNARIGTVGEMYMGEETENTNRRKSKDQVFNTEGKCLLKMTKNEDSTLQMEI